MPQSPLNKNNSTPAINNKLPQSEPQKTYHLEVVILKFVIIIAIVIIPVAFMLMDISNLYFGQNNKIARQATQAGDTQESEKEEDYHFKAPIPSEKMGDLSKVKKEKVDTLFDNLK